MTAAFEVVRRSVSCWLLLVVLVLCGGCQSGRDPELLAVADLSPRQLELGDRVQLVGDGFPEGRPARVELEGSLHRVGDPTVHPYRGSFQASSAGRNSVTFVPNEQQLERIVGTGRAAAHTTFRGEVRLAFSAQSAEAGPVYGTLSDVAFDVFPWNTQQQVQQQRLAEARRFTDFLGLTLAPEGFEVVLVKPGSRAEQAGIRGGDILLALDGVRLCSKADFFASGAGPQAELLIQRGKLQDPLELSLPVYQFKPVSPARLSVALLLVGFVAALLLLFRAPLVGVLTWIERRLVQRIFERRGLGRGAAEARWPALNDTLWRDLLPRGALGVFLRPVPYLVFLASSAVFALLATGQSLVSPDLDVPCLFLVSVLAMVSASFLYGGWRPEGHWSLLRGLRSAGGALLFQLPALLALTSVFVFEGTLRPAELVDDQGVLPWSYHTFNSPMMLAAFVIMIATCVPEATPRVFSPGPWVVEGDAPCRQHLVSRSLVFFTELAHIFIHSGLFAVLFLGGWSVSRSAAGHEPGTLVLLAQAIVLQAKIILLVFGVLGLRWALSRVAWSDLLGFWMRWLLPTSIATLTLSVAYQRTLAEHAWLREAESSISLSLFVLTACVMGYFAVRVLRALRGRSFKLNAFSLNPWL